MIINLRNVSSAQLQQAADLAKRMETDRAALATLLGGEGATEAPRASTSSAAGAPAPTTAQSNGAPKKRNMSAEAREAIAAAQRRRWAGVRKANKAAGKVVTQKKSGSSAAGRPPGTKMSAEGRAKIAEAQRARWAKQKGTTVATPQATAPQPFAV